MPSFGCEHVLPFTIPVEAGLAQARTGCNHRLITRRNTDLIQRYKVLRCQGSHAPARCFKIVDQQCSINLEFVSQASGFNHPRQVGSFYTSISDWARDTKTCLGGMRARAIDELLYDFVEAGIVPA